MKIIKYIKINSSKYKIILENNEKIILYEDVILNNDLLIKKEINDIDKILKENEKYSIKDVSLKYIAHHIRSEKEMREYLKSKNFLDDDINKTIDELIKVNYLNDELYAKAYINDHLNFSNDGPKKIIKYLENQNISNSIYNDLIEVFDKEVIYNKINKYIDKIIKTNKKSKYVLKNKIILNLINLGYDREDINYCLNRVDNIDDSGIYEKERDKLYNKLKKKYNGIELDRKVNEKLYQLGFERNRL